MRNRVLLALIFAMVQIVHGSPPKILFNSFLAPNWSSDTNAFSVSFDRIQGAGFTIHKNKIKPADQNLQEFKMVWFISDPSTTNAFDNGDIQAVDGFVRSGGACLLLLNDELPKQNLSFVPLLRHYRIALSEKKAPAKIQKLVLTGFENLRFYSPPTSLLDVQEGAFATVLFAPNDFKQAPLQENDRDYAGYRMVLAEKGSGRLAIVTPASAFKNDELNIQRQSSMENDNAEILLRLVLWLLQESKP